MLASQLFNNIFKIGASFDSCLCDFLGLFFLQFLRIMETQLLTCGSDPEPGSYPDCRIGSVLQQAFDGTQTQVGGGDVKSRAVVEVTAGGVQHCGGGRGGVEGSAPS